MIELVIRSEQINNMIGERWLLSRSARVIYTMLAVLIMLMILWEDTGMVGMISVVCIVLLPILAIWWAFVYGHRRNQKRRSARF